MSARPAVGLLFALILALGAVRPAGQAQDESALVARARAIHDRVITLDTHNDIDPANFTAACNYTMRLTTQVNLPKMKEGGLDVSFMIVVRRPGAVDAGRATSARTGRRSRSSTPCIA